MPKFCLCLILMLAAASTARAAATQAAPQSPDRLAPIWRSALVPGWGQAYNGETKKAWVLGGLTWGLLAGVAVTYQLGMQALHDYDAATTPQAATDKFNQADSLALTNEVLYGCFAAAYTWNVIDAGVSAPARKLRLGLAPLPKGGALASASLEF